MPSIAIVGAGMSGLAAAHTLRDSGFTVTLYEKSHSPGGRAATREQDGFIYDHGAQYVKVGQPTTMTLITERFYTPDLFDIRKPIWIFNQSGQIQAGDPRQNSEHKWSYRYGISSLPRQMAAGLPIHFNTHIIMLQQSSTGWYLFSSHSRSFGSFDLVLITLPAQQALELLQHSQLNNTLQTQSLAQLSKAQHNRLISVMLGYQPEPITRPYYALVNTDKAHDISWLAWEHEKDPSRAPDNAGLLIAQMSNSYSIKHWQTANHTIIQDTASQVAALLKENLPPPIFTDLQRWRYALPTNQADSTTLNTLTLPFGLAFCGDSFVGGRLHLALENGITVAQQIAANAVPF